MPEGDPHPSTLPGFRGTRDPERSVTRSRSGRKKKRVKFEDVQPQDIPNPTKDNFPRRCITQLPNGNRDSMHVHGTFTTVFKVWKDIATLPAVRDAVVNIFGQFMDIRLGNSKNRLIQALTERWWPISDTVLVLRVLWGWSPYSQGRGKYHIDHRTVETITWEPWFDSVVSETDNVLNAKLLSHKRIPLQVPNRNCEYYLGDRCWRQVTGEVGIPLDHTLSMSQHISPAALHKMRQAGFVDCGQFVVGEKRETYATYWAEQTLKVGHMLTDSQRMGNLDLFGPSALRAGITPMVVTSASVHSLSQDFSLPGEAEGSDLGWHIE
ncbi:hypothetical protein GIB67_029720 [Kingdonia uniflora]|uniref:Aminotransferase-like plant mobile domain-containing protein n=1 Tax=Kingdonia uniflora TaxID=39325 RepID=A0A7J7LLJ9_9MAGN|nr:hypothetical protein GIB67_029720 [Kingdonia uniflora]